MATKPQRNHGEVIDEALAVAEERSRTYLHTLDFRCVYPREHALAGLAHFREPMPEMPSHPADVVRMLDKYGSPSTVATTGGRYFGFVIGGVLPAALAVSRLVSTWD